MTEGRCSPVPLRPIDHEARRFWSAALFCRRMPARDQTLARRILVNLMQSEFAPIRTRATAILKGPANESDRPCSD